MALPWMWIKQLSSFFREYEDESGVSFVDVVWEWVFVQ